MRTTTACLLAAGLALLLAPVAQAQPSETTFTDPAGDAGPAGTELGTAGSDLDITEVTLTSDEDAQTRIEMELSSFDVRPPDTMYGVAFEINDTFVWAAYGNVILPFPPFAVEGYYGCQMAEDDHECTELPGEELSQAPGFAVDLPADWTPANTTAHHTMAAVFTDPLVPAGSDAAFEHAWPANAHDLAETDAEHEVPGDSGDDEAAVTASSTGGSSEDSTSLTSIGGASAAGLGLLGLAGVAVRRLG